MVNDQTFISEVVKVAQERNSSDTLPSMKICASSYSYYNSQICSNCCCYYDKYMYYPYCCDCESDGSTAWLIILTVIVGLLTLAVIYLFVKHKKQRKNTSLLQQQSSYHQIDRKPQTQPHPNGYIAYAPQYSNPNPQNNPVIITQPQSSQPQVYYQPPIYTENKQKTQPITQVHIFQEKNNKTKQFSE